MMSSYSCLCETSFDAVDAVKLEILVTKKGLSPRGLNPCVCFCLEAASGFEPENIGFAGRCLTTWLCRQKKWSGKRDSNSRLQPWQGCTLPLSYSRSKNVTL